MTIEDDIKALGVHVEHFHEATVTTTFTMFARSGLADDDAGLKAQAKRGSRAALHALAESGIYPRRLWRAQRERDRG